MNEHDEKIIGEEVTEPKEEATVESSGEALPETNSEQNTESAPATEITPAPLTEVKEYWSFSEQVKADKAAQKKKGRRGALAYAIIMTCLFAVCFALLAVLLITGFGTDKNVVQVPTNGASLADLVDSVIDILNSCMYFIVITDKPEEINDFITLDLHRGATISKSYMGVYSHEKKCVLLTVVARSQAVILRKKVKEIDPHAFVIITNTGDIIGKGFREYI